MTWNAQCTPCHPQQTDSRSHTLSVWSKESHMFRVCPSRHVYKRLTRPSEPRLRCLHMYLLDATACSSRHMLLIDES